MVCDVAGVDVRHHDIVIHGKCGQRFILSVFDMKQFTYSGKRVGFVFFLSPSVSLCFNNNATAIEFVKSFLNAKYSLYAQLYLCRDESTECIICLECNTNSPSISMDCCGCSMHIDCFARLCTSYHYTNGKFKTRVSPSCPHCRKLHSPFLRHTIKS